MLIIKYFKMNVRNVPVKDRRGRDRMVVGFTTTNTISAYYH